MNQRQPIRVRRSERHVRPHVALPHDVRGAKQREQYHDGRVGYAPVEGIEQLRIGEFVMGLVRQSVHFGMGHVFDAMHDELNAVLYY